MSITLAQICNAVEGVLDDATTLTRSQSYNQLTEGVHDLPLLQVYPEAGVQDAGTATDRSSFGGGVRQTEFTIHADYYAQQRSHIGEDMAALVDGIDAIQNELEKQDDRNPFGLAGIKSFRWSWERVLFTYGDPQLTYMAARFIIIVRVY